MPIRYNVSTLLTEPVGSAREHELDARVLIEEGAPRHQPVVGRATLLRTKHGVLVTARVHGVEHERCSRCLREFELPVRIEIEEEFFASADVETGARLAPPEDPEAFRIDAQHVLDLEEVVRQYLAAALPMQPLCQQNCPGLCPRCGQDLAQDACSCPPEGDERWSALGQLVRDTKGD